MNFDNVFYTLNNGTFKLSCPSVRFVLAPGYHQVAFEGSGFLRCTKFGQFEFELLVKATDKRWVQEINHCIPHDSPPEYFQLQLTDENGIEWLGCEWVRPKVENIFSAYDSEVFAINGTVESLVTSDLEKLKIYDTKGDIYQFIIPNAGRIPWQESRTTITRPDEGERENWSRRSCYQTLSINGISFLLEQLDDTNHIKVTIKTDLDCMPPFVDIKVLETIIFTTGRILDVGTQLRKGKNQKCVRLVAGHKHLETRQFPPINMDELRGYDLFWNAFEKMLTYFLDNDATNPFFHPFMETLIPVMEAGSRSIGIYSLTLVVAIEAIVENFNLKVRASKNKISDSEVKKIKKYINENISDAGLKNRLHGAIGSIISRKLSASDRLRLLVESEVITRKQFESWKSLRHTSAHGGFSKVPEKEDFDEMFGDVYTLANTMVLREAGYEEEITDYGALFSKR